MDEATKLELQGLLPAYPWLVPDDAVSSLQLYSAPVYDRTTMTGLNTHALRLKNVIIFILRSVKADITGIEKYIPPDVAPRLIRIIMRLQRLVDDPEARKNTFIMTTLRWCWTARSTAKTSGKKAGSRKTGNLATPLATPAPSLARAETSSRASRSGATRPPSYQTLAAPAADQPTAIQPASHPPAANPPAAANKSRYLLQITNADGDEDMQSSRGSAVIREYDTVSPEAPHEIVHTVAEEGATATIDIVWNGTEPARFCMAQDGEEDEFGVGTSGASVNSIDATDTETASTEARLWVWPTAETRVPIPEV